MTGHGEIAPTVPGGAKTWAVVRILVALLLLALVVIGSLKQTDATFAYLGGLTGVVALERRFVHERRSSFFNDHARTIDLTLAALVGAFVALLLW